MSSSDNLHGYRSLRVRHLFSKTDENEAEHYKQEAIDDELETIIANDINKISKSFNTKFRQSSQFTNLKEKIEHSVDQILTLENVDATNELLQYVDELNQEYKDKVDRYFQTLGINPKKELKNEEIYTTDDVDLYNEKLETSNHDFFETLDVEEHDMDIDHIIKTSEKEMFDNGNNHKDLLHELIKDVSNENNNTAYDQTAFDENIESIMNGLYEEDSRHNINKSINTNTINENTVQVEQTDSVDSSVKKNEILSSVKNENESIKDETEMEIAGKEIEEDIYYDQNYDVSKPSVLRAIFKLLKYAVFTSTVLFAIFTTLLIVYRENPGVYPEWAHELIKKIHPFYQEVKDIIRPFVEQLGDYLPEGFKDFLRPFYNKIREIF